jgi:hypothetical protein
MYFELVGEITDVETIASGTKLRERKRLWKAHGKGRWRKKKGIAKVRLTDGRILSAEVHWYEAHGIGSKEFKIKRILDWHEATRA